MERTGEDINIFSIDTVCYKLTNNFNFMQEYHIKASHYARLFFWVLPLVISCIIGLAYAFCVEHDDDDGEDELY